MYSCSPVRNNYFHKDGLSLKVHNLIGYFFPMRYNHIDKYLKKIKVEVAEFQLWYPKGLLCGAVTFMGKEGYGREKLFYGVCHSSVLSRGNERLLST